ncbi:MAG: SCP2 sterol-binding domain-containing protein [Candidatus Binataceae bacterium]
MADTPMTCKQVFEEMPRHFDKAAAQGLNAVYQFDLSGEGGGKWNVVVNNDRCQVNQGENPSPNITISMVASDYLDMVAGKLNPQMAFMTGKLRIAGDMGLALRLQSVFPSE